MILIFSYILIIYMEQITSDAEKFEEDQGGIFKEQLTLNQLVHSSIL